MTATYIEIRKRVVSWQYPKTVRIQPGDIGSDGPFPTVSTLVDSLKSEFGEATPANEWAIKVAKGIYPTESVDLGSNPYMNIVWENESETSGLTVINDEDSFDLDDGVSQSGRGYSITGNTLSVTSVGGAGDKFATVAAAVAYWESVQTTNDDASDTNWYYVVVPEGFYNETVVLANAYMGVLEKHPRTVYGLTIDYSEVA